MLASERVELVEQLHEDALEPEHQPFMAYAEAEGFCGLYGQ